MTNTMFGHRVAAQDIRRHHQRLLGGDSAVMCEIFDGAVNLLKGVVVDGHKLTDESGDAMIEVMPPPCTRVVFGWVTDGKVYAAKVDEMTHCSSGPDHPGGVREFDIPQINRFDAQVWVELPAAGDPRWRVYDRTRNEGYPKWGQEVLCFAKVWNDHRCERKTPWSEDDRIQYVHDPIGEDPHFPGFGGLPHRRDWGILKWMPLVDAFRDAKAIPAKFHKKLTPFQQHQIDRLIAVEHESENIFLSVINTGRCYREMFWPICKMGPLWIAKGLGLDKDGTIIRLQAGFAVAVQKAINYLVGRNELERDMNVWHDACNVARFKIAHHYYNPAKDLAHA